MRESRIKNTAMTRAYGSRFLRLYAIITTKNAIILGITLSQKTSYKVNIYIIDG